MGKPSTSHAVSRKSSDHNKTMSTDTNLGKFMRKSRKYKKMLKAKQKQCSKDKSKRSISRLFEHLRNSSKNTSRTSVAHNVIDLNDTQNTVIDNVNVIDLNDTHNTVIDLNDTHNTVIENPTKSKQECLIILDDSVQSLTPRRTASLHHSTPKQSLDEIIISQWNNSNPQLNETKTINRDSYLTIDLTAESSFIKTEPTVIDLEATDQDVTLVSASNCSSMSGDSEVTVLRQPISRKLRKFTNGIANLNAREKGKLLEVITQTIFNGCQVPDKVHSSLTNVTNSLPQPRAADTPLDKYIKEVILNRRDSCNSVGSNVYRPEKQEPRSGLRMIIIDGSNVAMQHGRGQHFSVRGLQICIDFFLRKGHVVKAFVPRFRCKNGMSTDPKLLDYLERSGLVIYTPSREIQGRTVSPYDDRYIIQCAAEFDGIIVSGDNYRDLIHENPRWRTVIESRVLPFTWVNDFIMFPKDPLGQFGPTLRQFLRHS